MRDLLQRLMTGFPDFHAEGEKFHHADDAVIVEARVTGTHTGEFAGSPRPGEASTGANATRSTTTAHVFLLWLSQVVRGD